jgi:site-specific DNA recombinase
MHVYSYSRFSTDRQTEATIADQQRAQQEHAARQGWTITEYFTDEGISGAALGNRPGALRMLEIARYGDVIMLLDLTRLCRSQDLAPLIERLRFKGVLVVGVLDNFISTASTARMQAGLSGLLSDDMRAGIRMRVHLALESRAKTARPTGGRAYGFNNAGEPVEPEASIARELFTRYAAGDAMNAIVNDLNLRGVPSPGSTWKRKTRRQDGRWLISALHAILTNDRYIGRVVWNRSKWDKDPDSGHRIRRERPESEWIVNQGERLVDDLTWQRTQARLKERTVSYGGNRGGQPRYLLSGLLVCNACGARLIVAGNKGSHYYCGTHRQGGASACDVAIGVRREVAEFAILQPIRSSLLSPDAVEMAVNLMQQWHRQERANTAQSPSADMQRLQTEIADLEALMTSSPSLATRLRATLEDARTELEALRKRNWRQASTQRNDNMDDAAKAYRDHAARMEQTLQGSNVTAAREVLRNFLGDVAVQPDGTGSHLVATVNLNPMPLLKAAGGIDWNGSGGLLWNQSMTIPLVK